MQSNPFQFLLPFIYHSLFTLPNLLFLKFPAYKTSPVSTPRLTNQKSKTYKLIKPKLKKPTPKLDFAWTLSTSWSVRI